MSLRSIARGVRAIHDASQPGRIEERIRASYGGRVVLLFDSGTSALRRAIEAGVRSRPGPVALPAYGCYDLLTAAHGAGAAIAFYDLDPQTLAPDEGTLRGVLAEGARTVVVAHLFGHPVDTAPIEALAREHGAWLIEDAAQGQGAELRGRPLGAFGDASVLSFARGKGRTGGGGGALIGHSPELAESLGRAEDPTAAGAGARCVARALAQWLFGRPSLYAVPLSLPFLHVGETVYREAHDVRPIAPAACGILGANWEASAREAVRRRTRAEELRGRLVGVDGISVPAPPRESTPGYLRLPVLVDPAVGLDPRGRSLRRLGISPGYPKALPAVRPRGSDVGGSNREGAGRLVERLWTLPTHGLVRDADVSAILGALGRTP